MSSALVTHVLASKDSRDTMSSLGTFFGALAGTKLAQGISMSSLVAVINGHEPPGPRMRQAAKTLLSLQDAPEAADAVIEAGLGWLQAQGFERARVLKMIREYGAIFGLKLADENVRSLREGLMSIAQRIHDSDEGAIINAVVSCPKCDYFFAV